MSNLDALNLILMLTKWWILAALALFLAGRSRNTSATTLHAILLMVFFALCALPWLQTAGPEFHIKIVPEYLASTPLPTAAVATCALVYGAVVLMLWAKLLRQLYQWRRFSRAGLSPATGQLRLLEKLRADLRIGRSLQLICSHQISTPLTYGWLTPTLVLPSSSRDWDINRSRRFLLHELAHVRRNDWLLKILVRTLVSVFWVVPGAWALLQKIEWLAELACDDVVICAEGARAEYADDLLEMTACGQGCGGAVALIENHGHYARITSVLDGGRVRTADAGKFWPYTLVFVGLLLLLASVRLSPATRLMESPYTWVPLVITAPAAEPVPLVTPRVQPKRPEKLLLPQSPLNLPQLQLENPAPDATLWELENFSADRDLSPANFAVEITASLKPLYMPLPEYPKRALKKNIEGRVTAEFEVLPDGSVRSVTIVSAEPAHYFDRAVMAALKQYRYPPQPEVITGVTEVFEFKLLEDALSLPAAQQ